MSDNEPLEKSPRISNDRVAIWEVPLNSGVYIVEFEHGTTTGKRVVRVNGKVSFLLDMLINPHLSI